MNEAKTEESNYDDFDYIEFEKLLIELRSYNLDSINSKLNMDVFEDLGLKQKLYGYKPWVKANIRLIYSEYFEWNNDWEPFYIDEMGVLVNKTADLRAVENPIFMEVTDALNWVKSLAPELNCDVLARLTIHQGEYKEPK